MQYQRRCNGTCWFWQNQFGYKIHKSLNNSKISECHFVNCFFGQESTKSPAWYYSGSRFQCISVRYPQSYIKFSLSWVIWVGDKYKYIQYTLVDCPGHASLIRTILGGAQIIDMLIIVIDCLKGIQAQTAECIVIGEITTNKAIFALNKIDLIPESERSDRIKTVISNLQKTLSKTRFKNAPIVCLCCDSELDSCICTGRWRQHRGREYDKSWRLLMMLNGM